MSDFHYRLRGIGRGQRLLDNTRYLNEELEKIKTQMDALTELLGVGFSRDGYEAFFKSDKKGQKKSCP